MNYQRLRRSVLHIAVTGALTTGLSGAFAQLPGKYDPAADVAATETSIRSQIAKEVEASNKRIADASDAARARHAAELQQANDSAAQAQHDIDRHGPGVTEVGNARTEVLTPTPTVKKKRKSFNAPKFSMPKISTDKGLKVTSPVKFERTDVSVPDTVKWSQHRGSMHLPYIVEKDFMARLERAKADQDRIRDAIDAEVHRQGDAEDFALVMTMIRIVETEYGQAVERVSEKEKAELVRLSSAMSPRLAAEVGALAQEAAKARSDLLVLRNELLEPLGYRTESINAKDPS